MKKPLSFLLVTMLILSFTPMAFAAHVHDDNCGYIPPTPCAELAGCTGDEHAGGCDYSAGSPCSYKESAHVCSFSIYDSLGNGTHLIMCSGNLWHQMTEACWSDNNNNHKCDHCGWVMSEHEYSYTPTGNGWHHAQCRCGDGFYELCSAEQTDSGSLLCPLCGSEADAPVLLSGTETELGFELSINGESAQALALENKAGIAAESDEFSYNIASGFLSNASEGFKISSGSEGNVRWTELHSGDGEDQSALRLDVSGEPAAEPPLLSLTDSDNALREGLFSETKIKMPGVDENASIGVFSLKFEDEAAQDELDEYTLDAEKKLSLAHQRLIEADNMGAESVIKAQRVFDDAEARLEEQSRTQIKITLPAGAEDECDSWLFLCQEAGEVRSISAVPDAEGNVSASFGVNGNCTIMSAPLYLGNHF